ncbi:hypothetical protein Angca_001617, partial [Angiostrongylus cantonensis]
YCVLGHHSFISRADGKIEIFVHQSAISISERERFYLRSFFDAYPIEFYNVEG